MTKSDQQRITQHKRGRALRTCPNFCLQQNFFYAGTVRQKRKGG